MADDPKGGTSGIVIRESDLKGDCPLLARKFTLIETQIQDLANSISKQTAAASTTSTDQTETDQRATTVPDKFKPVSSVTIGGKALGTTYQNTGEKPIFAVASVTVNSGKSATVFTDAAVSPTTPVAFGSNSNAAAITIPISFWVFPTHYYKIIAPGCSLLDWTEWT